MRGDRYCVYLLLQHAVCGIQVLPHLRVVGKTGAGSRSDMSRRTNTAFVRGNDRLQRLADLFVCSRLLGLRIRNDGHGVRRLLGCYRRTLNRVGLSVDRFLEQPQDAPAQQPEHEQEAGPEEHDQKRQDAEFGRLFPQRASGLNDVGGSGSAGACL